MRQLLRRRRWLIHLVNFIFLLGIVLPAHAAEPPMNSLASDEMVRVIVTLRPTSARGDRLLAEFREAEVVVKREYTTLPFMTVSVPASQLEHLAALPEVVAITPDTLAAPQQTSNAALNIGAETAWAEGYSGAGWSVAVLDTGVESSHVFLRNKVVAEACFSTNLGSMSSSICPHGGETEIGTGAAQPCTGAAECWHGTHVAGIAAGRGTDFSGVARDATIIAIQIFSLIYDSDICGAKTPCLRSFTSDQLAAFDYINQIRNYHHIAAINLSVGSSPSTTACDDDPQSEAIETLWEADIPTMVATGNDGRADAVDAPACVSEAIAVGATGSVGAEQIASFSNRSRLLDILAPGEGIASALPGNQFGTKSGTSMAAPHIAGAWAVLKSYSAATHAAEMLETIVQTGTPITDTVSGQQFSRIRLDSALQALEAVTPPSIHTGTPHITAISEYSVPQNAETDIIIRGSGFWGTPDIRLDETPLSYITLVSESEIRATIPPGLSSGDQTLTITNPDGSTEAIPSAIIIQSSPVYSIFLPLVISKITP